MAHQIFRSSCSITPLAVPRRCRSASWRQKGVERIGCWACAAQVHQKTQSKGKIGRAEMALTLINKLYGIERDMEEAGDAQRYQTRQSQSQAFLEQLKARLDKTPPQVTSSKGTVAKLAMRQPFVLFKGLTFQKLCLPGAFRPGDHHNKMLRPGLCVVHASPQYL